MSAEPEPIRNRRSEDMKMSPQESKAFKIAAQKLAALSHPEQYFPMSMENFEEIVGGLERIADEQLDYATNRTISRRNILRKGTFLAGLGLLAGAGILQGPVLISAILAQKTAAEKTRLQLAQQAAERQRQYNLSLERNNVLGATFSSESSKGWRIRYPLFDQVYHYVDTNSSQDDTEVIDGRIIKVPGEANRPMDTGIELWNFQRSDGVFIPRLSIVKSNGLKEDWLLRDKPDSELDTRVVLLQQPENDGNPIVEYMQIQREKVTTATLFSVRFLDRVMLDPGM